MTSEGGAARPAAGLVVAAFALVYLVWGSTYLAIRFAIETLPPLSMASARHLLAGGILYAAVRMRGAPAPARRQWGPAAVIGGLLLLGGNGAVVLAERTVPSGVAALLVAMVPLWMVLLEWARVPGARPSLRTGLGLLVGFGGMVLLVGPGELAGGGVDPWGALLLTLGGISWAAGSIGSRGADLPRNALVATAMQMLAGGTLLLAAGAAAGEWRTFDPAAVSTRSLLALGYLVVFGSLLGFSAYVWLLQVSTPARISTYAYVNPVVAVLLGWALAGEPLTPRVGLAAAVIVAAVALITLRGPGPRLPASADPAGPAGARPERTVRRLFRRAA